MSVLVGLALAQPKKPDATLGANAIINLTLGKLDYSLTLGPVGSGGDTRELTGIAVRLE